MIDNVIRAQIVGIRQNADKAVLTEGSHYKSDSFEIMRKCLTRIEISDLVVGFVVT